MRIEIERIILSDLEVPAGREQWLRRRIATELGDLLRGGGLPAEQAPRVQDRVQAPPLLMGTGDEPAKLARAVARSVFLGLGGRL